MGAMDLHQTLKGNSTSFGFTPNPHNLHGLNVYWLALVLVTCEIRSIIILWDHTTRTAVIYQHVNVQIQTVDEVAVDIKTAGYQKTFNKAHDGCTFSIWYILKRQQEALLMWLSPKYKQVLVNYYGSL